MNENTINNDEKYMKIAIEEAKKGIGGVNPNPLVGAVIVKNNKIIGKGYHKRYGENHAEINALEIAGDEADGATIYVTLEPCAHFGKTPPCALELVKRGIKKCVIGSLDSHSKVDGKGVDILKKAGIEVVTKVLEKECIELNQVFFKYINTKLPYIFIKVAITMDGKIALKNGKSKWITNEKSRAKGHYYRNKFMGIMVGINTVLLDNPSLTIYLENNVEIKRNPIRIVIDPNLKINENFNIVKNNEDGKTLIVTELKNKNTEKQIFLEKNYNTKFLYLEKKEDKFSLEDILKKLGEINIDSVLIEGGESLISQAFKEKIVDAGEIFISNKIVGDSEAKSFISRFNLDEMKDAIELQNIQYNIYDNNIGVEFCNKKYK